MSASARSHAAAVRDAERWRDHRRPRRPVPGRVCRSGIVELATTRVIPNNVTIYDRVTIGRQVIIHAER